MIFLTLKGQDRFRPRHRLFWDLKPGPIAPKARMIPLDELVCLLKYLAEKKRTTTATTKEGT